MAFDWTGYLELAKTLKSETTGQVATIEIEAKQRSAISRAYYAVYHIAVDYAKNNLGYSPQKGGPNTYHSDIRIEFKKQSGNPDHQEVGKMLARLHKARIGCDYDINNQGNLQSLLASIVIDADKIKNILST